MKIKMRAIQVMITIIFKPEGQRELKFASSSGAI